MQVLTNRDVKPSGRVLRLCFGLREAGWWLQLEVRKTSNLHYTTALHTISPVFTHHTTEGLQCVDTMVEMYDRFYLNCWTNMLH